MTSWTPPPSPLPPWAHEQEGDDKKLKDVRHSEELERYAKDMQKDIEKLKEDVQKCDNAFDAQKNYIEALHKLIPMQ